MNRVKNSEWQLLGDIPSEIQNHQYFKNTAFDSPACLPKRCKDLIVFYHKVSPYAIVVQAWKVLPTNSINKLLDESAYERIYEGTVNARDFVIF